MPKNIPVGNTNNISFGPAIVYMNEWTAPHGATPTTDVGFIGEDGVTIELMSEKKDINQGNPKLVNFSFVTSQSATISFTSIEYNFENFRLALGAGATTSGLTTETFAFGGNPMNTFTAMHIEHQMAVTGNTLNAYCWKTQSESGFSLPFGTDEAQFEFSFKAIRAVKDWNGANLGQDEQLIRFERMKI